MEKRSNHRYIAAISSAIYMGTGQLFNRQWVKGFLLVLFNTFVLFEALPVLLAGIRGLITLGETPMEDHSLFLIVNGIISILLLIVVIGIYIFNIRDAYKNGERIDEGKSPRGIMVSLKNLMVNSYAYLVLSPGALAICAVIFLPLVYTVILGFTNYDLYHSPPGKLIDWVGFRNFTKLMRGGMWASTFWKIFGWTVVWSLLGTLTQYLLGGFTAILLNNPKLKFKKILRTLLIIPWAVPGFVSVLIWRGMLNTNFGVINKILTGWFNVSQVPWLHNPLWAKVAVLMVNLWLGFPYAMIVVTGILQSIDKNLYEAATVDGASSWQRFKFITMPLVLFSMAPLMIMTFAYNFNNFTLIFLLNGGGPARVDYAGGGGATDILISWVYKLTFNRLKYNYAAAISLIIFIIVAGFAIYNFRRTRSYQEEEMLQ
ncbi:carbohydrate ABC transporter permease [Halothermothrix orenii]|nr:sugar ABC transporter permease [Halothermothrix orenii]